MRRAGQERALRTDQALHPLRGFVEALGELRHFVLAFGHGAHPEVAGAPGFDALRQALQSAGNPSRHGIGTDRQRQRAQSQHREPVERPARATRREDREPTPILQLHHRHPRPGAAPPEVRVLPVEVGKRNERARLAEPVAIRLEDRNPRPQRR